MHLYSKVAYFVGGALFGSAGLKLLTSKDAKKAYVHATAAGLRMKDCVMETVTSVQENANDILEAAKDLNEERLVRELEEEAESQICDCCCDCHCEEEVKAEMCDCDCEEEK